MVSIKWVWKEVWELEAERRLRKSAWELEQCKPCSLVLLAETVLFSLENWSCEESRYLMFLDLLSSNGTLVIS